MALLAVDLGLFNEDLYLRRGGRGRVKEIRRSLALNKFGAGVGGS